MTAMHEQSAPTLTVAAPSRMSFTQQAHTRA